MAGLEMVSMASKTALKIGLIILVMQVRLAAGQHGGFGDLSARRSSPSPVVQPGIDGQSHQARCLGCLALAIEPRITVASLPQEHSGWSIPDRISWVANLALAFIGYGGVILALSVLKKIERQTRFVETAAAAAAETAQAALLHAQSIIRSERPWIMVTAEPSPGCENSSTVVATNRGRSPAKIIASARRIVSAAAECNLPPTPEYLVEGEDPSPAPIILLPGESIAIFVVSREDVERFCSTEEQLKRVQEWDEKVYVHGKVIYDDFVGPPGQEHHETSWCCWYIFGLQKSGLVTIGLPAYNLKS